MVYVTPAIKPIPSIPAIIATTKKVIAQNNQLICPRLLYLMYNLL